MNKKGRRSIQMWVPDTRSKASRRRAHVESLRIADLHRIRLADAADVASLPSLERRAVRLFEAWLDQTGLTPAVLDDVSSFEELEAARRMGRLCVADTRDLELVGFAQATVLDGLAHLDEVDVVPEHSGRGVGSHLVEAVCDWARDSGYPAITLVTFRDVPWNRPFYERRGFREIDPAGLGPDHDALLAAERARGYPPDRRVVMVRALSGSA